MKKILKKMLICILILFIINNFLIGSFTGNVSYASFDDNVGILDKLFNTVVGLLTWPIRLVAMSVGLAVNKLMSAVAYIENGNSGGSELLSTSLTPFDVLFNTSQNSQISLLDINFFNIPSKPDSIMYKFRSAIAVWYYALRTIAAAILLVVLIYVGIRMALSNVSAGQKATYKKMLVDWVVSLAIIFLMQYIMLFVIYVNNAIVDAIRGIGEPAKISASMDDLGKKALSALNIDSIAATVVYCMLVFQTFGLFISYFNRMLTLAFLTLISPLITLTYSIDKIGDGKAQALNTWLKEYVFTVLIQPFHCIIYMAFVNVAVELLCGNSGSTTSQLAASIIAILCINFMKEGEKIVRKIFSFGDNGNSANLGAGMAVAAIAAKKAQSFGKNTRKTFNGIKTFGSNAANTFRNAKVDALVMGRVLSGNNKDENGNAKSVDELKSEVRTEINEKNAEKEEKKRYGVSKSENQAEIDKRTQALMAANGALTKSEAASLARLAIAKETRKAKRKASRDANLKEKHPNIYKARGTIRSAKEVVQQSETLKELGNLSRAYVATGIGLAIGSGVYGATGKAGEAFLSGVATYRGAGEFMKNSTATLKKSGNARLKSLGVSSSTEAAARINKIMANADKYEGTDELNKIMDELKKALTKAGVDDSVRTSIQNTIKKGIASNPSIPIKELVDNTLDTYGISDNGVNQVTMKLATFDQEQGIYNDIKNAGDIGLSPDAFAASMIKSFDGGSGYTLSSEFKTDKQFLDESIKITEGKDKKEEIFEAPDDQATKDFVNSRNERDLEEFYKTCDKEKSRIEKQLDDVSDESIREKLIAQLNQIEAARVKVQDVSLDREVDRIRKESQEAILKANAATERSAQRQVDKELERLQREYDKYIDEANNHIGRVEATGAKTETELTAQKIQLEAERANIQSIRNNLKGQPQQP